MAETTVSGILTRIGMGRLGRLGLEPAERYERARPGELIHVDVKKLGRILRPGHRVTGNRRDRFTDKYGYGIAGWEFVHVCVDDATRLAYAEVLPDEKATTAIGFLRRALAFYRRHGISVERLLTDNGSAYRSKLHAIACRSLGIRHLRTRPYRPQTNGKGGCAASRVRGARRGTARFGVGAPRGSGRGSHRRRRPVRAGRSRAPRARAEW